MRIPKSIPSLLCAVAAMLPILVHSASAPATTPAPTSAPAAQAPASRGSRA